MTNDDEIEKITICLPSALYNVLRNQAYRQNISLPEFVRRKVDLKPSPSGKNSFGMEVDGVMLSKLPLNELLAKTAPVGFHPDERLDFFRG